jgi:hypothetical protein
LHIISYRHTASVRSSNTVSNPRSSRRLAEVRFIRMANASTRPPMEKTARDPLAVTETTPRPKFLSFSFLDSELEIKNVSRNLQQNSMFLGPNAYSLKSRVKPEQLTNKLLRFQRLFAGLPLLGNLCAPQTFILGRL